jgi:isocitrate lyase
MVKARRNAIHPSGSQVAADAIPAGRVYPEQSLYACSSSPKLVKRPSNAPMRAAPNQAIEGEVDSRW